MKKKLNWSKGFKSLFQGVVKLTIDTPLKQVKPKSKKVRKIRAMEIQPFKKGRKKKSVVSSPIEFKSPKVRKPRRPASFTTKAKLSLSRNRKLVGDKFAGLSLSSNITRADKNRINNSIKRVFSTVQFLVNKGNVSDAYYECIQKKFAEIRQFLKDLESVDYKLGLYIREFGFHDDFWPEQKMELGSPKIVDAILSFEDFLLQCNRER